MSSRVSAKAIRMARAIQRFRNLPMLKHHLRLRETKEYAELQYAWEQFVDAFPEARLNLTASKGDPHA